jgi:hypothetical protein
MAIILRTLKGSALTHSELDANFTTLDERITTLDATSVDSSVVLALAREVGLDSAQTIHLIDSDYVQARQLAAAGGIDSAATFLLIDSDYIQSRQLLAGTTITSLTDVNMTGLANKSILKYDLATAKWLMAVDDTTNLSVIVDSAGSSNLVYDNGTGAFTFTPPDLTPYITGETDTLEAVIARGATATSPATFNGGIVTTSIEATGAGTPGITSASGITLTAVDDIVLAVGAGQVIKMGGDVDLGTSGSSIQHKFSIGANGSTDYTFDDVGGKWFPTQENDPVLYLRRGEQYIFDNASGGSHPLEIRLSSGGAAYSTGVTNNGASSGSIIFTVPMSAPATLYYQCTSHASMGNTINIV